MQKWNNGIPVSISLVNEKKIVKCE